MKYILQFLFSILFSTFIFSQNPNHALNFDGINDYVSFDNGIVDLANHSFTIDFWAKKDVAQASGYMLTIGGGGINQSIYVGWIGANTLRVGFFGNDLITTVVNDGEWHHYAVTYDLNQRILYVDGTNVASDTSLPFTGPPTMRLGSFDIAQHYFSGSIDRLSLAVGVSTEEEINEKMFCENNSQNSLGFFDFNQSNPSTTLPNIGTSTQSGTLHNFSFNGTTSGWVTDTPTDLIPYFSALIPDDEDIVYGEDVILNSNFVQSSNPSSSHTFQWYRNGMPLVGEESTTLSIADFASSDNGIYRFEASNQCGTVVSNDASINGPFIVASDLTSDYFIDVNWNLPVTPCLIDDSDNQYNEVTVQLLRENEQIEFTTFDSDALLAIYGPQEPDLDHALKINTDFISSNFGPDPFIQGMSDYTVEMWFKPHSGTEDLFRIIPNIQVRIDNYNTVSMGALSLDHEFVPNTWTHISFVADQSNTNTEVFVNGISIGILDAFYPADEIQSIGDYLKQNYLLGEFRLWDVKRSGSQIQQNMSSVLPSTTNLVTLFKTTSSDANFADRATTYDGASQVLGFFDNSNTIEPFVYTPQFGSIDGSFRDLVGPDQTKNYTINVFVGPFGNIDTDCFGLTATGSTSPTKMPTVFLNDAFDNTNVVLYNNSDLATSYQIYRDSTLIHTITDFSVEKYYDKYSFSNASSIESGKIYNYELRMISSNVNQIDTINLGNISTYHVNPSAIGSPTNTEKIDLNWAATYSAFYDEIQIWRDGRLHAVKDVNSSTHTDLKPLFGDSIEYQLRFLQNDTIRADFGVKGILEGNGEISGRVTTLEGLFPVADVEVSATRQSTDKVFSTTTNASGQFTFSELPYGLLDSFELTATYLEHTFVYPTKTIGISANRRTIDDALILDNLEYSSGTASHTINSFSAIPILDEDKVDLNWDLTTTADEIFIDLIRNGKIIFSSNDMADLVGSYVDLGGTPGEETTYEIRIYTISGSTVSVKESKQEIIFPPVASIPTAAFNVIEEQLSGNGTGNVVLSFSHTSTNFDKYRVYRNETLIAELDPSAMQFIDDSAPFDSSLIYTITAIRELDNTTYETEIPTDANPSPFDLGLMPSPANVTAVQQANDPSILISWTPPAGLPANFNYEGYLVYRNDELISTVYKGESTFVSDYRGIGMTDIAYSVVLFKHTEAGIIESEKTLAIAVDFPLAASIPDIPLIQIELSGPDQLRVNWQANSSLSSNISGYLLMHNDTEIARLPPYYNGYTHFPESGSNHEYKLFVINSKDGIEYMSTEFSSNSVNFTPSNGIYPPQNVIVSRDFGNHVKICWEYLDFISSQFIIYKFDDPIDTLPVGTRSYYNYDGSAEDFSIEYSVRAFQGGSISRYTGGEGGRAPQRVIYGTVLDNNTMAGIPNVGIELEYTSARKVLHAFTDSSGYYSFITPKAFENNALLIKAYVNGVVLSQNMTPSTSKEVRVDFVHDIPDRPLTTGIAKIEYADGDINHYSLNGNIHWRVSNDDYDGVEVYRGLDLIRKVPKAEGNILKDSLAVPGINYSYFIRTYKNDVTGISFSAMNEVAITYPPVSPVINLTATPQPNSNNVLVQWSHKYEHADGYLISINGDEVAVVEADTAFLYYDNNGVAGQEYTYTVNAYKTVEAKPYFSTDETVTAVFPAAADVKGLTLSIPFLDFGGSIVRELNHVLLEWEYESNSIESYKIFRDDELIKILPADSTSYADYEGIPESMHTYHISAVINQNGIMNESTKVGEQIVFPALANVTDQSFVDDLVNGKRDIQWKYHSEGIEGFKIRITESGTGVVDFRDVYITTDLIFDGSEYMHFLDIESEPGVDYLIRIVPFSNRNGIIYEPNGTNSSAPDFPLPSAPIISASDGVFERAIEVSWDVSLDNNATHYEIIRGATIYGGPTRDTFGLDVQSYLDVFSIDEEIASNYAYFVKPCRRIEGVMTCFSIVNTNNGSVKVSPQPTTSTSGSAGSNFGAAVDVHNEWMIVGGDLGSVSFYKIVDSEWVFQQKITPSDPLLVNSNYGSAVAIWEDLAVVGAPHYDPNPVGIPTFEGAIITYKLVNDVWTFETQIVGPGPFDQLGTSVDIEDNTILTVNPNSGLVSSSIYGLLRVFKRPSNCPSSSICVDDYDELPVNAAPSGYTSPILNWNITYQSNTANGVIDGNDIFLGVQESKPQTEFVYKGFVGHFKINGEQVDFQSVFSGPPGVVEFGNSLDAEDGKLAVSAISATGYANGLVIRYNQNGSDWTQAAIMSPSSNNSNTYGNKVRYVNDLVLVNEALDTTVANQKVYLYKESGSDYDLLLSPNSNNINYRPELYNDGSASPLVYTGGFAHSIALTSDQVFIGDPSFGVGPTFLGPKVHSFNIYDPKITSVIATDNTLEYTRITWTSECESCLPDFLNYRIYRDGILIGTEESSVTEFFDDPANLINGAAAAVSGQVYTYEVSAVSGVGTESIKVADQGYSKRKGEISGSVFVQGTNIGVADAIIDIVGVDEITNQVYSYSTMSQSDGAYSIEGIYVATEPLEYKITPSFEENDLEVNGSDVQVLSVAFPEKSNILIFDKTVFEVKGNAENSISGCGIEGLTVRYLQTVNGVESVVDSTVTDENGFYSLLVKPKVNFIEQIKIQIDELLIVNSETDGTSDTVQYEILENEAIFGAGGIAVDFSNFPASSIVDFEESLSYPMTIYVQNACQNPVADQPVKLRISSVDGCMELNAQTNSLGVLDIDLPPKSYLISVESLVGSGVTNYENAAIDYLKLRQYNIDILALHEEAGVTEMLPVLDPVYFEYHRLPTIALSTSFDRYQCDDPSQPAIITQGDSHTVDISISENHMVGESCEVYGGYVLVLNPASAGQKKDTLYSIDEGFPTYEFTVGGPNLVAPYSYGLSMQYYSDDGNFLAQRIIPVIAEGQSQLPGTGIITESDQDDAGNLLFPLLVLRDPPGDGSYSSIESGTTITKTLEIADESKGSLGFHLESEITFATVGAFLNLDIGVGGGNSASRGYDISLTTSQTYSTSDSDDAVGRGADVIVGSGLSQQYGLARSLFFEDNCTPTAQTTLSFGTGGFVSTYSYTIDFIEGLIDGYIRDSIRIEEDLLEYSKPNGDSYTKNEARTRVSSLITSWKEMIRYHDVETVPHYVLCNDLSYRNEDISPEAEAAYEEWRDGFCTLIGTYTGDKFVMDDEIEWTPALINAYNNTIAFTDKLKDPLTFVDDGNLTLANNDIYDNNLSVTNNYHNLLGNQLKSAEVFDVSGNVALDRTVTAQQSSSTSKSFTRFFNFESLAGFKIEGVTIVGFGILQSLIGLDISAGYKITAEAAINVSQSQAEQNQTTVNYHIFDDDAEDQVTFIALQAPLQDQTPYFIRLGGLSSCPAEEALTVSQDNAPLQIDSFNMAVVIDSEGATTDVPPARYNVDTEEASIFEIKINSLGPTALVRDAQVFLDLASNPTGAIVKIGGSNLNITSPVFSVPVGGSLTQFISVERPPNTPFYKFDGLRIGIKPACGGDAQFIELSVFFDSPCSDVSLTMPLNKYVVNRIKPIDPDNPNAPQDREVIPFEMRDYDSGNSSNLEYIQLEYRRLGNNSGWLGVPAGRFEKDSLFASDATIFEWDITGRYSLLPDGDYLVRAQAFCASSGVNYSNEVEVEIRRSPLLLTGYPQPADKIWTEGDEISSTFSSDIDCDIFDVTENISDYLSLIDMTNMTEVPFEYVCKDNKMTLIPMMDMDDLDGHMLRATYTGILSLEENAANTIVWDFKVVTTAVDWSEEVIEITLYENEVNMISTSLFNRTNTFVDGLSISGGSGLGWLTVNPSAAFSVPAAGLPIELIFDGAVTPGDYSTVLNVNGLPPKSNGSASRIPEITVMLHVIESPPFPAVSGTFTDSMQLVLNWSFTDPYLASTDISDAIYVYKDGQLRGSGFIVAEGNFHYTKIKVYGNSDDEGELLDFVVWNANQQTAYSAIDNTSIPFEANTSRGLIPEPQMILVDDDLFQLAQRIYVDHTNNGTQDGRSWATAFSDLQDGIGAASDGDEIWIAEGTYRPTAGGDRSISYSIISAISIYGGFETGMTDLDDRTGSNETILSGDILIPNVSSDNSLHVIEASSSHLLLNGITINDGNANMAPDDKGGCLYNTGSVTLENCKMENGGALSEGTLLYNSGQMIIDGGIYTIPAIPTTSNLYNDTGALITIRQNVSIVKE